MEEVGSGQKKEVQAQAIQKKRKYPDDAAQPLSDRSISKVIPATLRSCRIFE
jgi:hypothetical protein